MKTDDLSWLVQQLGLPVLEETASGLLASPVARAALPSGEGAINEAAAQLMAIAVDDAQLVAAIAAARGGERHASQVGPNGRGEFFQLLAAPTHDEAGAHRIRLTIAPAQNPSHGLVDLAAAVSHEVANAVGTIRGWADLALHEGAAVDVRDALSLIRSAARSAEQAARGMLSLARGQASELDSTTLDLSVFVDELLRLLTLSARELRVRLDASIEPGLRVRASRAQLFTILFNLLKNALEACQPGGRVHLRAGADQGRVRVSVSDEGPGLDAHARQRIFERYYTTKAAGTGLGLALVQSAVAACQATLELDSEPGRGSVFRVSFERRDPPTPPHGAAPLTQATDPFWNRADPTRDSVLPPLTMRVLVVDDDQPLREMLATALHLRGAEVVSAGTSDEARALSGPFDVALIDMMLDDCRGDELLAHLRQRGVISAALLVTGTVQKPRLVPGGEPDDWVRKPFEISHLVDRIRRTLERHRMLASAESGARA